MVTLARAVVCAALVVATAMSSCSSTETAGAGADGGEEGVVSCQGDPRVLGDADGLVVDGAARKLRFRLIASDPAPPGKGNNTLTLEVRDAAGASAPWVLKTNLKMPDHGHPTPVLPAVTYDGQRYTLSPVFMFMPGVWRLDLFAYTSDDAGPPIDTAALFFCVEG